MNSIFGRMRKSLRKAGRTPKLSIRTATLRDIPEIVDVELAAWGAEGSASADKLESRIRIFPEGQRVAVVEESGARKIVGFVSTMRLSFAQVLQLTSWAQITNDGYISSHDPGGDYLYGVDLSVRNGYERMGVGNLLLGEIAEMVVKNGIRYGLLGGRLPGLREFNDRRISGGLPPLKPGEYIELRRDDGRLFDRELRFYMSIWSMENLGVLPNYFSDPDSLDNGVLLRWPNPLYRWFFLLGLPYRLPLIGRLVVWLNAKVIKALV